MGPSLWTFTDGDAPYRFTLNGNDYTEDTEEATYTDLPAGTYSISATDNNGCTATVGFTVSAPGCDNLTIRLTATPPSCDGLADGKVEATAAGGQAPYVFSFDGGQTFVESNALIDILPGTYLVTVRDTLGCVRTDSTSVTETPALTLSCRADSTDADAATGVIFVTPAGGTPEYQLFVDDQLVQTDAQPGTTYPPDGLRGRGVYRPGSRPERLRGYSVKRPSLFGRTTRMTVRPSPLLLRPNPAPAGAPTARSALTSPAAAASAPLVGATLR